MKLKNAFTGRPALAAAVILVLAVGVRPGGAGQPQSSGARRPVVLEYKMPTGRALTYQSKSEEAQVMEIQGQPMDTQTNGTSTFTFKAKGLKDKNFLLGVTIDDVAVTVTSSAQGDMSPDMSIRQGQVASTWSSPRSDRKWTSPAPKPSPTLWAGETRNLSSGFKMFFPDLRGKAGQDRGHLAVDRRRRGEDGLDEHPVDLQNVNTLEGFETVDGMECARISSQVTGTITGTGNQGGMDLTFSGTSKGKDVWYFAVKEGIYVKADLRVDDRDVHRRRRRGHDHPDDPNDQERGQADEPLTGSPTPGFSHGRERAQTDRGPPEEGRPHRRHRGRRLHRRVARPLFPRQGLHAASGPSTRSRSTSGTGGRPASRTSSSTSASATTASRPATGPSRSTTWPPTWAAWASSSATASSACGASSSTPT